jgi:dUTP pyrophosphatase
MRGFKVCKGFENSDISLPKRGTKYSAGYDIESCEEVVINPKEVVVVKTGVKAYMKDDEVLQIYPRSSLGFKKHLMLANTVGIIDSDYFENEKNDGHIMIGLYNYGNEVQTISKHERIAQGIFSKYLVCEDEEEINTIRKGGIGSTNK